MQGTVQDRPASAGNASHAWPIRAAILAAWIWGVFRAVHGGFTPPGMPPPDYEFRYPLLEVLGVVGLITGEAVLLYAIIRPGSYRRSWRRALVATALFAALASADLALSSSVTCGPGYVYANLLFLVPVLLVLLVALLRHAITAIDHATQDAHAA
jgi:hypothetical protein